MIGEEVKILVPSLGIRLYKLPIPGFAMFRTYVELKRLDLALFMALFLFFAVSWLWRQVLRAILRTDDAFVVTGWDPVVYRKLILILGGVLLGADAILFYLGAAEYGWGGGFSFSAIIATLAYAGVLVFVSLVSLHLHPH